VARASGAAVAGTWAIEHKRGSVTLRVSPFAKLPARIRNELLAEGERLAAFLETGASSVACRVAFG
jgi:DNA glycosylase AlkZ-like